MALVLGARIGDRFSVGVDSLTVTSIDGDDGATVLLNDGTSVAISMRYAVEVAPDVFVFLGAIPGKQHLKLAFDAPPTISILRRGAA